jgi:hypothetical protein
MIKLFNIFSFIFLIATCKQTTVTVPEIKKEKTAFQTSSVWIPEIDVRSDIAIVYGANDRQGLTFEERVKSWRDRKYETHFMTGIAWGDYQDYYLGKWDGKNHMDVSQVERNGKQILHGKNNPYVVPVSSFIEYLKSEVIKKVIDAGISSIYLEEPEFWARAGYSELFKTEWQNYYGFPWKPQHESPENTYLSNKLKYQLYYNAIKEVSDFAKEYGKSKGINVKVYIPTHSLINYSSWQIVSPEASLASLPGIDGYIAQVWTGTSREPTYFNGLKKERVFENAFLEYGSMVSMTAPTKRKIFFLTDPIEDRPRDWQDYKQNYEATFTAQLLYPMVADYEVMPWPERIYTHSYQIAGSDEKVLIPRYYSTQMQVMINTLNDMPLSENVVSGSQGIGVLMSNSLMFQRFPVHNGYDDPQFSNFYGQTLPLLKRGIPVETVHIENLEYETTLKNIKVLIMSYSNMKPLSAESHTYLEKWVRSGGVLIYCGKDDDPYQQVMEWWNMEGNSFRAPSEHLFKLLNIASQTTSEKYNVEKGAVYILKQNPKEFVLLENGDKRFVDLIKDAYENAAKSGVLQFRNYLYLERGSYDIVSVMDENVSDEPFSVKGILIDLYDPKLPVLSEKIVQPGTQALLYNIGRLKNKKQPRVLAAAARIYEEKVDRNNYSFIAKSPVNTTNSMRILLPQNPKEISVKNQDGVILSDFESSWDNLSKTLYLRFENNPDGVNVSINWQNQ